jgi:hypothetical protein
MFSTDDEYRSAILDFFSLSDFDEEAIIGKTNLIYEKVKDIECFQKNAWSRWTNYVGGYGNGIGHSIFI